LIDRSTPPPPNAEGETLEIQSARKIFSILDEDPSNGAHHPESAPVSIISSLPWSPLLSSEAEEGFGRGVKTVMCRLNVNGETVAYSDRSVESPEESTRALQRKDKKEETSRLAELLLRYVLLWQPRTIALEVGQLLTMLTTERVTFIMRDRASFSL
jgi:hypothetical protein